MKKRLFLIVACTVFSANLLFSQRDFQGISGINTDNYPRVDAATGTDPVNYFVAARLLGLECVWINNGQVSSVVFKNQLELPASFTAKIQCSQTHNAIINLIDNQTDLIIVGRKMSADEKEHAKSAGVLLTETPIALDALDFVLNAQNTVESLTVEQIQNIYLGDITNWSEVGGADETIKPFIRNPNSGSQEMMNEIVMNSTGMPDWEVSHADEILGSMIVVYSELTANPNGICYTPHYYKEYMVTGLAPNTVKTLAVNKVMPDKTSIENCTYPFVRDVYVSIRSDLDPNTMAYKLYEWLQTPSGQEVVAESGYVPYSAVGANHNIIISPAENELYVYPNPASEGFYIQGIKQKSQVNLFDYSGRKVLSKTITDNNYVDISYLPKGFYLIQILTGKGAKQFKVWKK